MLRVNDCFALLKKVAALVTVLLLRFFSPTGFGSSLNLRPKNPVGGDNFFVDTMLSSEGTAKVEEEAGVSILLECGTESDLSLGGLEEEPLNILFSNPPWLELLRLFPASLKVETESTRGGKEEEEESENSKSKPIETSSRRGL